MRKSILGIVTLCAASVTMAQSNAKDRGVDDVVGHYRFASGQIMSLDRSEEKVTATSRGQPQSVLTKTADGRFNYPSTAAYLTFDVDANGMATTLHYHFDDRTDSAARIDAAAVKMDSDKWDLKIKNQTPSPECATSVKRLIDEVRAGEPDYSKLSPLLSRAVRSQTPMLQSRFKNAGPTQEVKFKSVDPSGNEIFDVTFENGSVTTWRVLCLLDGYLGSAAFRL